MRPEVTIYGKNTYFDQGNQGHFRPPYRRFLFFLPKKTQNLGKNPLTTVFIVILENFGKIDIFCLSDPLKAPLEAHLGKMLVFRENMKYRSKNHVFRSLTVKYRISDAFSTYISDTFYGMLLSSKTKKLPPFFRKKCSKLDILAKNGAFLRKTQNHCKKRVFRF